MTTIRCSSLDRVMSCAHSLRLPIIVAEEPGYATEGTNKHERAKNAIEAGTTTGDSDLDRYIYYVKSYNIETSHQSVILLGDTEYLLRGTCDAYGIDPIRGGILEVVDLKTGYKEVSPFCAQLKGYAYLIIKNKNPDVTHIKLTIFQDGCANSIVVTKEGFCEDFEARLAESVATVSYESGKHCTYCPSKAHCLKMLTLGKVTAEEKFKFTDSLLDLVKYKPVIDKLAISAKKYCIEHNPNAFKSYVRRTRVWKDASLAPKEQKTMTVAKALREGWDSEDNIKYISTTHWRLNE